MIKNILFVTILIAIQLPLSAQTFEEKSHVIKGNKEYIHGDYLKAESQYKIALSEDANSLKANYNLGNALYSQKKFDEARAHYDHVLKNENSSKLEKAHSYHNIGKTYLDENEFEKAAHNFKESLKLNPNDDETRYNYSLAKKRMKEQQEKEKPKNQDPNESDEKGDDKDNKGSQNEKENPKENPEDEGDSSQQKNQGEKEGGEEGNEEGEGDQPQQQNITKGSDGKDSESEGSTSSDRQEGMLEALRQQEKETLKKIISNKAQNGRSNSDKDW